MRLYEIVYIFDPDLDQDGLTAKMDKFHEQLTAEGGGEIVAIDLWGVRQLAYPIKKKKSGYYVVAHFRTAVEALPEFERLLKLDEGVMRYLLVANEGEPTSGSSIFVDRPARVSEDDDDDEGDEDAAADGDEGEEGAPAAGPPEFQGGFGRRRRMEGPPVELLNYKDVATLSRFMTEQGKILPKRTTKVTARFQRDLGRAIKRARYLSLVPYVRNHEV
jgi:small subunit ribosomal protein S6